MTTNDEREIWKAFGMEAIENLARTGRRFTADNIYAEGVPTAPHPNMVGRLFRTAMGNGYIRRTGNYRKSTRRARKGSTIAEYVGLPWMILTR